jgi:hypothetical protein
MPDAWYLAWNMARVLISAAPNGFPSDANQIARGDGDFLYGMSFALHWTGSSQGPMKGDLAKIVIQSNDRGVNLSPFGTLFT